MISRVVKEWIKKAEHDFIAAGTISRNQRTNLSDVICFHCQQTVEKYLKAYLTSRNIKFQKTHDLGMLLTQASKIDGGIELIRDIVEPLTEYAVTMRYPGEEPARSEAKRALKAADQARRFIRSRIG